MWHFILHIFRSIRSRHLLIALILLLGSFIVYGATIDSIIVGVAVSLIACVTYEFWRKRPKVTVLLILFFVGFFPLQKYYFDRNKENKVIAFIVDSLSNMPLEQSQHFYLFKNLTHGEVVRSLIEQNGHPDKTYLLNVDDFDGKVNTRKYKKALQTIDNYANKHPKYHIVVNISLGSSEINTQEEGVVKSLLAKGVILVASAGNEGEERLSYPAGYPGVIAVGASDNTQRASYSNYGVDIDILANGQYYSYDVVSIPGGSGFSTLRSKVKLTGTSFATARVSGVIIYMLQLAAERDIEPGILLKKTAQPINSDLYVLNKLGAGLLNKNRALKSVAPFYVIGVIYKATWKLALLISIVFLSVASDKLIYVIIAKKLKHPLGKKSSILGVIIVGAGAGIAFIIWSLYFVHYWSIPKEIRFFVNFPLGWFIFIAGALGATRLFGTLVGVGIAHLTLLSKVRRYRLQKTPSLLWEELELVSAENVTLRRAILKGIVGSGQEGILYLEKWISQNHEIQYNDKMLEMVKQFDESHKQGLTDRLIKLIFEGAGEVSSTMSMIALLKNEGESMVLVDILLPLAGEKEVPRIIHCLLECDHLQINQKVIQRLKDFDRKHSLVKELDKYVIDLDIDKQLKPDTRDALLEKTKRALDILKKMSHSY